MSYRVEVQQSAKKELAKLSSEAQKRVAKNLIALANNPLPPGSLKLTNRDGYRVRVGDYRILYLIDKVNRVVIISAIAHRSKSYRRR